ncbi:MAG: hypothetical protein M1827_006226 [Pycnora praestabilis]|nr:MAG: hypothetical protein M1827_006226 [Pycnora praestabilis]
MPPKTSIPQKAPNPTTPTTSAQGTPGSRKARTLASRFKEQEDQQPISQKLKDVDILNKHREGRRNNPKGVRVCEVNMENNASVMAGYLGLGNTAKLRDLIEESDSAKGCLDRWFKQRHVGFGIPEKTSNTNWRKDTLWTYIEKPDLKLAAAMKAHTVAVPLDTRWGTTIDRGFYSFIVTMSQLIEEHPECFRGEEEGGEVSPLLGITYEDWHRVLEVLRHYWKTRNAANKAQEKARESGKEVDTGKRQSKPALEPIYLTDADLQADVNDEADLAKSTQVDFDCSIRRHNVQSEDDNASNSLGDEGDTVEPTLTYEEQLERFNDYHDKFAQSFKQLASNLANLDKDNPRPPLDRARQAYLLAYLGRHAKILYPEVDILDPSSVVPTSNPAAQELVCDQMIEEALNAKRAAFRELQKALNSVTADPPSYKAACRRLKLAPEEPYWGPSALLRIMTEVEPGQDEKTVWSDGTFMPYPWQIVAVSWLLDMEASIIGGGLIGDDMGLGKTVTVLLHVMISADRKAEEAKLHEDEENHQAPIYRPTLVLCPSSAFGTWKAMTRQFFPLANVRYFMGNPDKGPVQQRLKILGMTAASLRELIEGTSEGFDKHSSETAKTIILSTYTTWLQRSIDEASLPGAKEKAQAKKCRAAEKRGEDLEEEENDNDELNFQILNNLVSLCTGLFDRVICDEAHKLKSYRTRTSWSVKKLNCPHLIFMSATPMINKPLDLSGILHLLWKPEFKSDPLPEESDYEAAKFAMGLGPKSTQVDPDSPSSPTVGKLKSTQVDLDKYVHLLDPDVFRSFATKAAGQMDMTVATKVLPPILRMIQLRRVMSDFITVNGVKQVIGKEVPPYTIVTVELKMNKIEAQAYKRIHRFLIQHLKGFGTNDETEQEHHMSMRAHRYLMHTTYNPELDKYRTNDVNHQVTDVNEWCNTEDFNYGATFYHQITRGQPWDVAYQTREEMAHYMCALSVKQRWLAGKMLELCIQRQRKVIIFCDWPVTLWDTTAFLLNLNIKAIDIRSVHSMAERDEAVNLFNDPDSGVQALVTSLRTTSASVNLQHDCPYMIFMEVPGSANILMQAVGHIYRIGQKSPQFIWICTVDHTYDQTIQYRAANKMIGQIAGQGNVGCTDEEAEEAQIDGDDPNDEDLMQKLRACVIQRKCVALYVQSLGQRDSRHEWSNAVDLEAKDALREPFSKLATRTGPARKVKKATRRVKAGPSTSGSGTNPVTTTDQHSRPVEIQQHVVPGSGQGAGHDRDLAAVGIGPQGIDTSTNKGKGRADDQSTRHDVEKGLKRTFESAQSANAEEISTPSPKRARSGDADPKDHETAMTPDEWDSAGLALLPRTPSNPFDSPPEKDGNPPATDLPTTSTAPTITNRLVTRGIARSTAPKKVAKHKIDAKVMRATAEKEDDAGDKSAPQHTSKPAQSAGKKPQKGQNGKSR